MKYFQDTSADLVWQQAVAELVAHPDHEHCGRNGVTREFLPCALKIEDPRQRWILSRHPPYNPAFAFVEFIWIITGNNESRVINYWNPTLPKYSGSGDKYYGAYGYRLRHEFGLDQIQQAYLSLLCSSESRQVILQIWKPELDLPPDNGQPVSKDIPCNVMSMLKVRNGHLHWSQIMRSNDIMRGLPNDIVLFTMLQEVIAGWLGVELGHYFHLSDSLHVYESDVSKFSCVPVGSEARDRKPFSLSYAESNALFFRIYNDLSEVSNGDKKEDELREIFDRDSYRSAGRCELIKDIMAVIGSDAARRQNYTALANYFVDSCIDPNLKKASLAWLEFWKRK